MAQGHNHWIPVADLLSAFVVVCLLLFVSAAIKPVIEDRTQFLQAQERGATLEQQRTRRFVNLKERLVEAENAGILAVDPANRTIEFQDLSFESGSACLSQPAQNALLLIKELVLEDLSADQSLNIYLEGHTDPVPVGNVRRACGIFENNTQLSTLRASNVRDLLIEGVEHHRSRMPVTGWGPDRLRNVAQPTSPANRRVELKWHWPL
jgi:flagellar motor protein MotB